VVTTRVAGFLAVVWLSGIGQALAQEAQGTAPRPPQGATGRAAPASPRDPGRPGSFDLSVSALWLAPSSLGSSEADLIANDARGSAFRLFTASGDFDGAAGFEGRAGYHLTRMFAIEGGVTYSRPGLAVAIANDAEGAAGVSLPGETVSQFFLDAALVVYPVRRGAAGGRLRPFIEFGAGYLRELHGQTGATSGYLSKETGQVYHLGGGARYFFHTRPSGFLRAYGLRFDARYYLRNGGFSFDGSNVNTFAAGAGLVLGF
jgi:hypothetical protein